MGMTKSFRRKYKLIHLATNNKQTGYATVNLISRMTYPKPLLLSIGKKRSASDFSRERRNACQNSKIYYE